MLVVLPSTGSFGEIYLAARLVVLVSGSGTNLAALLEACEDPAYGASVVAVGADRHDIEGLERAERARIPTFVERVGDYATREQWDAALTKAVAAYEPDLVVSAGFMKILGAEFLATFPKTINTHPSLLPAFPGASAVRDALDAGVGETGATVHYVDSGVDTGPVIDQVRVGIEPGDDESSLHERIKVAERQMLVEAVRRIASSRMEDSYGYRGADGTSAPEEERT
ncbi:MAG TPA: phosphoribosylglycinamide formyltransferase [Mycobacteriales bacterium]|nr:phosphoribosylglycinamide formyltransferase [Mycobacteriales bacterium]